MAEQVTLPRLGQGMESGTIVRWLKSEGDQVKKGEPLYELDTDKVTQEVEADVGGVLLKILVNDGEVPVGTPVAFLGEAGENLPEVEGARRALRRSLWGQRRAEQRARQPEWSLPLRRSRPRRPKRFLPSGRIRPRPGSPDRRERRDRPGLWAAPGPRAASSSRTSADGRQPAGRRLARPAVAGGRA